jgi:hypothetical protein
MEDLCIKPSALWVPHKILKHHTPWCPICETNESVDVTEAVYVDFPRVMFCVAGYRYLNTVKYPYYKCRKHFRATNLELLKLDKSGKVRAALGIRLLKRCTLEEDLYFTIVSHKPPCPKAIADKLKSTMTQKYQSDMTQYYLSASNGKIKQ